jgi:excisionase family DNA binding protein
MIYFTSDMFLQWYVEENLLNQKKSKYGYFKESLNKYYLKGSNKLYSDINELFADLQKWELLFIIKDRGPNPNVRGYVFNETKYKQRFDTYGTLDNDVSVYKILTINQVCEFLSVSRPTVYKLIRDGKLPTVNFIGQKRIQMKVLLKFINDHTS